MMSLKIWLQYMRMLLVASTYLGLHFGAVWLTNALVRYIHDIKLFEALSVIRA